MKTTRGAHFFLAGACLLFSLSNNPCHAQPAPDGLILHERSTAFYPTAAVLAFDATHRNPGYRVVPWYGTGTAVRVFGTDDDKALYRVFDDNTSAYAIKDESGTHLYLHRAGSRVGPPLQLIGPRRGRVAFAVSNDKSGILSVETGRWVLDPADYLSVGYPVGGRVIVWKAEDRWGIYDDAGNQIGADFSYPLDPTAVRPAFTSDVIAINVGDSIVIINKQAEVVAETEGEVVGRFFNRLARATANDLTGLTGYINDQGDWAIEPRYGSAGDFREGLAPVSITSIYTTAFDGTISRNSAISPRTAREVLNDPRSKWGFIDPAGELVIPATFDRVAYFSEGLAAVRIGGKWGYIDREGSVVIPPSFSYAGLFRGGLAHVTIGEAGSIREVLIDEEGNVVAEY